MKGIKCPYCKKEVRVQPTPHMDFCICLGCGEVISRSALVENGSIR